MVAPDKSLLMLHEHFGRMPVPSLFRQSVDLPGGAAKPVRQLLPTGWHPGQFPEVLFTVRFVVWGCEGNCGYGDRAVYGVRFPALCGGQRGHAKVLSDGPARGVLVCPDCIRTSYILLPAASWFRGGEHEPE